IPGNVFTRIRYRVYNLCAERSYNHAKFKDRVEQFAMQDHNPPLIHTIPYFCHIRAASQYFHLATVVRYNFRCKKLVRDCHQDNRSTHRAHWRLRGLRSRGGQQTAILVQPASPIPVNGDVKIVFYHRSSNRLARYDKIFHFWLKHLLCGESTWRHARSSMATGARPETAGRPLPPARRRVRGRDIFLTFLTKAELDKACKDRLLPDTFSQAATAPPAGLSDDAGSNQQHHQSSSSSCSSQTDDDEDPEKAYLTTAGSNSKSR
uniref:C2 tensin-type domain-containing protein n=1 Tax=Macrostomum lignano TaxID=282301 RepID=A0A1I8FDJ0_9PLAT